MYKKSDLKERELAIINDDQQEEMDAQDAYHVFMEASGGERLLFFTSFNEMQEFIMHKMKYADHTTELPTGIGDKLVLTATPKRGIAIINAGLDCIKHPTKGRLIRLDNKNGIIQPVTYLPSELETASKQ